MELWRKLDLFANPLCLTFRQRASSRTMSIALNPLPHAPLLFSTRDSQLLIGDVPIGELAERVGSTPFYAYDRGLIAGRVQELRSTLPAGIKLHYAIKANPLPELLQFLAALVDGLDVASGGELARALASGSAATEISFAGPGKRRQELCAAVGAGVLLNVESRREVKRLSEISAEQGKAARIAVRINPDFELKSAGMRMGGGPKPFGVDVEQVPDLLAEIGRLGLAFEGFHLYAGSQNLRAEAIAAMQRQSYSLICRLAEHAPAPVRSINLGGGFGIPYFPGEQRLALPLVRAALQEIVDDAGQRFPQGEIRLELGRYLVGEAGVYVTRVVDIKVSRGHTFVVCDGGMHHHLAASGNFGQVLRKNYPLAIANRMDESGSGPLLSVVGPLCTPLDLLADKVHIGNPQIDDLIVVFQSGAYGASASPSHFLGHPPAREILL